MNKAYIEKAKREIKQWESQGPGYLSRVGDFMLRPAERTAKVFVPKWVQNTVSKSILKVLVNLNSATHRISNQESLRNEVALACDRYGDELKAAVRI